jgi:hypothetical protein
MDQSEMNPVCDEYFGFQEDESLLLTPAPPRRIL